MTPTVEEQKQAAAIMKACPDMTVGTARNLCAVWLDIPGRWLDEARIKDARRVYDVFPPGYTFLIHFNISGGGSANQPFVTGKDPFPTTYGGKKVVYIHRETHVSGPTTLLRLLLNLNQLSQ